MNMCVINKTTNNYIRQFIKAPLIFSGNVKNSEAFDMLSKAKEECAVVIDDDNIKGLLMKEKLYRFLGSIYGHSLYANRPITKLMDTSPLIVEISLPESEMMKLSMERDEENKYDSILLMNSESFLGFITVKDLLLISSLSQRDIMNEQIENMLHSRELTEHIKNYIEKVKGSSALGQNSADEMLTLTFEGREHIDRILNAMNILLGITQKQVDQIEHLKRYTEVITGFIRTIDNLSDKINLLALNASIEAARAGEHGKGFNILAQEIRKLAFEAKGSSCEIAGSIMKMRSIVEQTVSMVLDGRNEFVNSCNRAEDMNNLFRSLFESIDKTKGNVSAIFASASQAYMESSMALESIDDIIERLQCKGLIYQ